MNRFARVRKWNSFLCLMNWQSGRIRWFYFLTLSITKTSNDLQNEMTKPSVVLATVPLSFAPSTFFILVYCIQELLLFIWMNIHGCERDIFMVFFANENNNGLMMSLWLKKDALGMECFWIGFLILLRTIYYGFFKEWIFICSTLLFSIFCNNLPVNKFC